MASSPAINTVTGEPQSPSGWSTDGSDEAPGAPALAQGSPLGQPTMDQTELGRQEAGIAAAQKPYYDKLNKILSTPQTATAHLEKIKDAPNPQDYQKASLQYGGAMALVGAIGAAFARKAGNASLKAFGAALKGWNEGNLQAYEQASQEWEQNTKKTIQNNNVELEKYHEILANKQLNIDQMTAGITVAAAQYQNKIIYDMAKSGNFAGVAAAVDKLGAANQRLQNGYSQLSGYRSDQRQELAGQIEALNNDPEAAWNLHENNPTKWFQIAGAAHAMGMTLNQPQQPPGMQTLDADAERYRQTGTLPPNMGRGQQGYNHANQIRQRAVELETAAGGDPAQWPHKWQQYKAAGAESSTEARIAATRIARVNYASNLVDENIPAAAQAAKNFPQGKFVPIDAAKLWAARADSSIPLSRWDVINLQLLENYALLLNPGATSIRQDMFTRAAQPLSQAKSTAAYLATLDEIQKASEREREAGRETVRQQQGAPSKTRPSVYDTGDGSSGTTSTGVQYTIRP